MSGQRLYVVDHDDLIRASLILQLQPDYDVMGFAAARHFLDAAPALPRACVLLDVHMPEIDGPELQRRLVERNLHFPIVMITSRVEVRIAVEAMKAGAVDFVEKPFTREAIRNSIRLATERLDAVPSATRQSAAARMAALTPRELQVVEGLVAGLPNKANAYDLGLSPRTVEMHRARIMKKLDLRSLSALVRLAVAAGITK